MMNNLGTIVHVDLSEKKVTTEPFGEQLARNILGGFGFNTWYLYKHLPKDALALGPENILIISRGLLTGTAAPASSRSHISAKSPLSGLMGSSNVGGHIGARLRSLGIAAMVINGRSNDPVSLLVDETGVSFRTGQDLWGLDTRSAESVLRKEREGQAVEILSIGVAGENLVPFACIMNGTDHAAGRTGMGAIMGSKNLKAILVAGVKNREKSAPEIKALVKAYIGKILSLGVKGAAKVIGKGSEQYAYHTKGVEIYGSDPRGSQAIALSYTVSLRGGDFTSVYPIPAFRYTPEKAQKEFGTPAVVNPRVIEGKGILVRHCLFTSAIIDSLGLCKVPALSIIADFTLENESLLVRALTGLSLSAEALLYRGEQLVNMEKLFNLAHGASKESDNLPGVFQEQGLPHGSVKGLTVKDLSAMVQDFYKVMGWDEAGIPTGETLKRLKLEEI